MVVYKAQHGHGRGREKIKVGDEIRRGSPLIGLPAGLHLFEDLPLWQSFFAELGLPTLIVQEGGYRTRTLGTNARSFFLGFLAGQ